MKLSRIHIRTALIYSLVAILSFSHPTVVMAEDAAISSATTAAPVTVIAPSPNYTYDPATGHWNSDQWYYDGTTGKYEPIPAPASSTVVLPTVAPPTTSDSNPPLAQSAAEAMSDGPVAAATATTTTDSATSNGSAISAGTTSTAQSGDAIVANNTVAGNATTGSAQATDTLINTVNSSTGGGGVVSFVSNVSGDVNGDIQLYPMILSAMASRGVISSPTVSQLAAGSTTVSNNSNITNNVDLGAVSGSATVSGNTSAGSATSGSANTVVNVMNLINSMVASSQSFLGVINIYGNLNGNILLAPDFIPQLIASNASAPVTSSIAINNTSLVNNNISLDATSGAASVSGNTSAGSATSGTAMTNIVLLNLSGHQVIASNSLLVFVNVLGKWVGVIVDAPAGSTAAVIGSGVSQNNISAIMTPVVVDNNAQITNNIRLSSQSGNASVANNTNAGSAVSGSATASANVLNMTQSTFGLSGWFGALFINVFGSWLGSFGVNIPSGDAMLPIAGKSVNWPPTSQTPLAVRFIGQPAVLHVAASPTVTDDVMAYAPAASQPTAVDQSSSPATVLAASTTSSPLSNQSYISSTLVGLSIITLALVGSVMGRRFWPTLLRRS